MVILVAQLEKTIQLSLVPEKMFKKLSLELKFLIAKRMSGWSQLNLTKADIITVVVHLIKNMYMFSAVYLMKQRNT